VAKSNNPNFLSPLSFKFVLSRTPNINFNVQTVRLPGMSLSTTETATPFVTIPNSGKITYAPLTITFRVNEDMSDYLEIDSWMKGLGSPNSFSEYADLKQSDSGLYSDATLIINNSRKLGNISATFYDLFPIEISDLQFTTMDTDVNYLECTVDFRYLRREIGVLNS
jgi:hypothetical protein